MKKSELKLLVREEIAKLNEIDTKKIRQKVIDLLVKYGNNPKDVEKMVDKNFDYAVRVYPGATPAKLADVISTLRSEGKLTELFWPQSKLSKAFGMHLKNELDRRFRGHDIYGKGYDIYVDGTAIPIDPDKDSIDSIVHKVNQSLGKPPIKEDGEGPTKAFNGVAGKYQDLLKQKQDAIKAMKDFLGREKDPGKRAAEIKRYNSAMAKLNAKIAEHERRFTKAMLSIKDVDGEDELL